MQPHQQRVVDEKTELDEKRNRLSLFRDTKLFQSLPLPEQNRMNRQMEVMKDYSRILGERIAAFEE